MDSIKIQKQQAMRSYKIKAQILGVKIAVYTIAALISSLSYMCIFWFPTMKHFVSMYLPTIYSFFFTSKFLFILANFIVVILIGDSILKSDNPLVSPTDDEFYHECSVKKERPLSCKKDTEIVRAQDQVMHPLKTVKSYNMLHSVTDPKKSMASDQVLNPLKTVRSCNMLHGMTDSKKSLASDQVVLPMRKVRSTRSLVSKDVTDPKKSLVSDQVVMPMRKVRSTRSLVSKDVTDPKKSSMSTSKTQGQRKKPKRQVHEKTTTTCITHDQPEVVEIVEKVIGMELNECTAEDIKGNSKEEETIYIHHDDSIKDNGMEIKVNHENEDEEEIHVYYQDHDSLQRDELNRKVEDFIARVNRRRMLEIEQGAY